MILTRTVWFRLKILIVVIWIFFCIGHFHSYTLNRIYAASINKTNQEEIIHKSGVAVGRTVIPYDKEKQLKLILLWTAQNKTKHQSGADVDFCHSNFKRNCVFTTNRGQYETADAIVFSVNNWLWKDDELPAKRFPWQHYIAYTYEPSMNEQFREATFMKIILPFMSRKGVFNLTSSFRSDSDIHVPYFYTKRKNKPCDECITNTSLLKEEKKLMAWFVSHCKTDSMREKYISELSKHIPIDIFGRCGKRTDCNINHKCTNQLIKGYKFYFAGENALCDEYHTEKLYRPLNLSVVPVVYAELSVQKIAPPHSYIDVRDFKSPRHLAEYLLHLDKNDAEYMSYFAWRRYFEVLWNPREPLALFCRLCDYLHTVKSPKIIDNYPAWFFNKSGCKTRAQDGILPLEIT